MLLQKKSNNEFNLFEMNLQDNVEASIISFKKDYKITHKRISFHFQF